MDQPGSSKPLPPIPSSTAENPVRAVARKVKSALSSSNQQPSVRLLRQSSSSTGERRHVPVPPQGTAIAPPLPPRENTVSPNRFASAPNRARAAFRSLFGHEEGSLPEHESSAHEECDHDMVDLMDVVGMFATNAVLQMEQTN